MAQGGNKGHISSCKIKFEE